MKTCPECKIRIEGPDLCCPLCGTKLHVDGNENEKEGIYPDFSKPLKQRSKFPLLAKIFAFISFAAIFSCSLIDLLISHQLTWSLYVSGGIAALWASVGVHLLTKINLNYKILLDFCALSGYLLLIDYLSGWNRWSIDYVIPVLYIAVMIAVCVLAMVFREYWREYILSLVAVSALGIIPLLIFCSSKSPMRYLCLGAVVLAALLLLGLLYFYSGKLFSEWKRRMNI